MKALMLDQTFASDYRRAELRVSSHSARYIVAVLLLGAKQKVTLRKNSVP